MKESIIKSDCCIMPLEFIRLERVDNRTYGVYKCIECEKEYARG